MVSKIEKEFWKDTGIDTIQVSSKSRFRDLLVINGKRSYWYFEPKITRTPAGYLRVRLDKTYRLHRIIAAAFIPNPHNLPQVNHKDGNKQNNNPDNLEWVTGQENSMHSAYVLGNESSKLKRPVNIYKNGKLRKKARSVSEAARYVKCETTFISRACQGKISEYNGYTFEYGPPNPLTPIQKKAEKRKKLLELLRS